MKKVLILTISLFLSSLIGVQLMGQDGYQVGDEASSFDLLNIDGNMFSPEQLEEAKGYIIVFTCNHCPVSKAYEDRIVALDKKYSAKGYPVIAINPNDAAAYPDDSFDNMVVRAEEKGFGFPYLVDETQDIARAYGATRTPHTYVVEKSDADQMIVRYIGSIDDNRREDNVETRFVEDAVDNLLEGNSPDPDFTTAVGCSIKWK